MREDQCVGEDSHLEEPGLFQRIWSCTVTSRLSPHPRRTAWARKRLSTLLTFTVCAVMLRKVLFLSIPEGNNLRLFPRWGKVLGLQRSRLCSHVPPPRRAERHLCGCCPAVGHSPLVPPAAIVFLPLGVKKRGPTLGTTEAQECPPAAKKQARGMADGAQWASHFHLHPRNIYY